MKEYSINKNDAGQRLDKYLSKAVPLLPQALMHKYIRLKRVKVNGKRAELSYRLCEGDMLQLYINDEFFDVPPADEAWRTAPAELSIVYEDEHLLLCDKQPGLVVHEDEDQARDTLINRIKSYLYQKGDWRPEDERSFTPALCNRIDRNTGGIVIAAKTAEALRVMNEKIRDREIGKHYLCLVHGTLPRTEGTLRHFLLRDEREKRVTVYDAPHPGAKTAELRYRVCDTRGGLSLVECRLITGRTHQIRAQMAHIGHPLVGDTKYGTAKQNAHLPFSYQALYAFRLAFDFQTPAAPLDYLKGRVFELSDVPFLPFFRDLPKKG